MCANVDRQEYAKKLIQGRGRDVIEQRTDRRQRLIQKFKSLRVKSIDNFRNLDNKEFTYELLCELRRQILSTLDQESLIHEDDVDDLLGDLEKELKIVESEQYDKLNNEEIEAITTNLLNKCSICENLITESSICDQCTQRHLMTEF